MELKYSDEKDKCYGMAGMAVAIMLLDAADLLATLDIDAPANECVQLIPTYYFSGNPRVSAKASWQHIFKHYQVAMGMTIGNVICRSRMLHNSSPSSAVRNHLLDLARKEGEQTCTLEYDEVKRVFTKSYDYFDKVFSHNGVQQLVRQFATTLTDRRQLSHTEVAEALAALSGL